MNVRLRLAGPLEVVADDRCVRAGDFPGRQGRLVFAALALAHRPVDRNELAEILWPNRVPSSWTRDLSAVISKLRTLLTGIANVTTGNGRWYAVELPPDAQIDVEDATAALQRAETACTAGDATAAEREARTAIEILTEPFLAGDECVWVDERRAELARVLGRALTVRATVLVGEGSPAAVEAASDVVACEPEREDSHILLIRAHLALGNRVEALRAYERLRKMLAEDFGLSPSPAADELMRAALGPDDEALVAPARPGPAVPLPVRITDARRSAIIGREHELDDIAAVLDGRAPNRLVAIVGPPGIGKSRIACEAAAHAHERGAIVLFAACNAEPSAPYAALVDAFAPVHGAEAVVEPLAADGSARARGRTATDLFAAVASALDRFAAGEPVVLVLDDAHWADGATVRLVEHLVSVATNARVVLTARAGDLGDTPAGAMLTRLRTRDAATVVRPGGLSPTDVARALHAHGVDAVDIDLVHAVRDATGGNPLYVRELGRHLAATGTSTLPTSASLLDVIELPASLTELIEANLARLDVRAQRTLEAAAVIGGHAEVGVLARVCRLTPAEFLTALDAARQAGVLVDTGTAAVRFEHPLVREVLLKRLGPARRAQLHRRVADAIEAFHADEVDRFSAELAHHLAATANLGGAPDAMAFAVTAGERAEAVCAYDEAAHWYAHALRLSHAHGADDDREARLLTALGRAQNHAGDARAARGTLLAAVDAARGAANPERFGDAVLRLSSVLVDEGFEGGMVDARLVALLDEAIAALPASSSLRARLLVRQSEELHFTGDREGCLARCDEAEAAARATGDLDAVAAVLGARHYNLYGAPGVAERVALLDVISPLRTSPRPDVRRPRDYLELGDLDAVDASTAHLERSLATSGVASDRYYPAVLRATVAALRGDLTGAEVAANHALEIGRDAARGPNAVAGVWAAQIFAIRLFDGRLAEISDLVDRAADATPERPIWRAAAAFMHLELGERERAGAHLAELRREHLARVPDTLDRPMTLALCAWVAAAIGTRQDARVLSRQLRPYRDLLIVQGAAAPSVCAGPALFPLAMLEARLGHEERAHQLLDEAETRAAQIRAPLWHDRIRRARASLAPAGVAVG